jgi:serine/threonine protein kinase
MDYCPGRSLEGFIRNNEITLTPATLIYLMYQATQSLRFLAVCGIQHLDVKPPNMLIARNLLLRLTDFGESYHPEVCSNGTKQLTQIITQDLPCLTLLRKYLIRKLNTPLPSMSSASDRSNIRSFFKGFPMM